MFFGGNKPSSVKLYLVFKNQKQTIILIIKIKKGFISNIGLYLFNKTWFKC